ncbi:MAG: hypothetical protein IT469_01635 [Pseudomonadales bacterium]|nr:hypothetical protein [Pseudomonadales bacterium]
MSRFSTYFERDYATADDLFRQFGEGEHALVINKFGLRESYDQTQRKQVPKPVVWLDGVLGNKPLFINRGSHDGLCDRFGAGYEDDPRTIGQTVTVNIYRKRIDGKLEACTEILDTAHPDMHAALGQEIADRWHGRLDEFGGSIDGFRKWLRGANPKLAHLLDGKPAHEWPRGTLTVMGQYVKAQGKAVGQ